MKEQPKGFPLWILAVILPIGGALLLCCGCAGFVGFRSRGVQQQRWEDIGNSGKVGDVNVEFLSAKPWSVMRRDFGAWKINNMLLVKLKLTNTSPTKMVNFGGWHGKAALVDEHGNDYKAVEFGPGLGGFGDMGKGPEDAGSDTSAILARNLSLHPSKSYITYLFFETPAAVSKEARFTMPANELGGTGTLRLKVPISQ